MLRSPTITITRSPNAVRTVSTRGGVGGVPKITSTARSGGTPGRSATVFDRRESFLSRAAGRDNRSGTRGTAPRRDGDDRDSGGDAVAAARSRGRGRHAGRALGLLTLPDPAGRAGAWRWR
ncbi:hypothetical protein [Rhodococcus jostii]|uniref:Uncharacterized protein n=1 Tax=Rhodococcus jostii TaxID=132919 RepID=A0A1H4IM13_RHOJO|nr:hypothetical protein [Rhodococcus jostii]SEB34915.1 hypothetical protein SAMN04490220_0209 [Rhodococcus jostii]